MTAQANAASTQPSLAKTGLARFEPANRRRLSGPALRTFLAIADLWNLSEEKRRLILGYPSRSTYHSWTKQVREHRDITLDVDVLMRISAVLGIHQGLRVLFENEREGVDWLTKPHHAQVFGGSTPIDILANGTQDGLMIVRRFIDAARGGLYMPPAADEAGFAPYEDSEIIFQ